MNLEENNLIFIIKEDIYNRNKTQVMLFKNSIKNFELVSNRYFKSYAFEFCGMFGISIKTIRFLVNNKDIKLETKIEFPCIINVIHKVEFSIEPTNSLKYSLNYLFNNPLYYDLILFTKNNKYYKLHRCIWGSRSSKFLYFLNEYKDCELFNFLDKIPKYSYLKEEFSKEISLIEFIPEDNMDIESLNYILQFIYTGNVLFPNEINIIFNILRISFFLNIKDLLKRIEENILNLLNENNLLQILIDIHNKEYIPLSLKNKIKVYFLKNFQKIKENQNNWEEELYKNKGLISSLIELAVGKKGLNRKVTFWGSEIIE